MSYGNRNLDMPNYFAITLDHLKLANQYDDDLYYWAIESCGLYPDHK
jgi:hypothetical protein